MPQPPAYERQTDFTERDGDDTDHPALNQELDAAALSIDGLRTNVALIQRDDGGLKNGVVTADSLADSAFDAVLGNVNQAVGQAQDAAQSALTSATTANSAATAASAAAVFAATSQTAAAINATGANASAMSALASQVAANGSAATAAASSNAAGGAATTATTKAAEAAASAGSANTAATTAATKAGIATAKAVQASGSAATATKQAGIATTEAESAAASAQEAQTSGSAIALRNEIAAPLGAALIGTQSGLTGSIPRQLQDVLSEEVSDKDFPSLSAALNSGASTVTIAKGTTVFPAGVTVTNQNLTEIRGHGYHSVLDFSGSTTGLVIESGITSLPTPTFISGVGGMSVGFPPGTVVPGDLIILYNPSDFSLNQYREYYRDGFMARVSDVAGGVVTLFGTIPEFNRSTVAAYKLNNNKPFRIDGVRIIPPVGGIGLHIKCRQRVTVGSNLHLGAGGHTGIEIERCFDIKVDAPFLAADYLDAYPVVISNSQSFKVWGLSADSTRHCIGLGGRSEPGSVPTRDGRIFGSILKNNGRDGAGAADAHGNCVNIQYDNCTIDHGAAFSGRNIKYSNCDIYSRPNPSDGNCVSGGEVSGGLYVLADCTLHVHKTAGGETPLVLLVAPYLTHSATVVIDGLRVVGSNTSGGLLRLLDVYLGPTANDKYVNVSVRGVQLCDGLTLERVVGIYPDTNGTPLAMLPSTVSVELAGIGNVSETVMITVPLPPYKFRITGERRKTTFTLPSGATYAQKPSVPFKYYPRAPDVEVFSNSPFLAGGLAKLLNADNVATSSFNLTASVIGGTLFSSVDITVVYDVSIQEF